MANKNDKSTSIRVPLHRAPFYFGPDPLDNSLSWRTNIERIFQHCAANENLQWRILPTQGWQFKARCGPVEFTIDAETGSFEFEECTTALDDHLSDNSWLGPKVAPFDPAKGLLSGDGCFDDLLTFVREPPIHIKPIIPSAINLSGCIALHLLRHFEFANRKQRANIECKWESISNAFSELRFEEIKKLKFEDRARGEDYEEERELDDAIEDVTGKRAYWINVLVEQTAVEARITATKIRGRRPNITTAQKQKFFEYVKKLFEERGKFQAFDPSWNAKARLIEAMEEFCDKQGYLIGRTSLADYCNSAMERLAKENPSYKDIINR